VTEAIFGLVGVLTGGIDYFMRRRVERQAMRALARALHAEFLDMRSQCAYCAELGNWLLVDQAFTLPRVWQEHELVLGRLLTWEQWAGVAGGPCITIRPPPASAPQRRTTRATANSSSDGDRSSNRRD
jgi:hypothetical protein